eukprot:728565-Prorocentrum_minimum.AAC.1
MLALGRAGDTRPPGKNALAPSSRRQQDATSLRKRVPAGAIFVPSVVARPVDHTHALRADVG